MDTYLEPPISTTTEVNDVVSKKVDEDDDEYIDDSNCSTPYVSAPSSPGARTYIHPGFFYSAPTSPMHYVLSSASSRPFSSTNLAPAVSDASSNGSFEFEFSSRFDSPAEPEIGPPMSSADELFLNGQIRPMKLCAHLSRPQQLPPFQMSDIEDDEDEEASHDDVDNDVSGDVLFKRSKLRHNRSQRRRTRSMSPLRSTSPFDWLTSADDVVPTSSTPRKEKESQSKCGDDEMSGKEAETTPSGSASSSRCSSAGRSSKRWVFLKDFLRSKSEGRSNNKFWHNISFSPSKEKEKKMEVVSEGKKSGTKEGNGSGAGGKAASKRRSAHEIHYAANRAQAEEMRKKTYLPYRQGLLGCLGFNSKSYGAINGFARALNPVSSR